MMRRSYVRENMIARRLQKGGAQADYFADVFNRWMRIYGPDIAIAPRAENVFSIKHEGFRMLTGLSRNTGMESAASRIEETIPHFSTSRAFWDRICSRDCDKRRLVAYVNGRRYTMTDAARVRRFCELFMLHSLISMPSIVDDAMAGVGKMMGEFNQGEIARHARD